LKKPLRFPTANPRAADQLGRRERSFLNLPPRARAAGIGVINGRLVFTPLVSFFLVRQNMVTSFDFLYV
jgi:hypothetical protein